jgi:hypothetical protein
MTTALEGGEGVSVTPRSFFTPGKDPLPIVQEAGWAPGQVWTGAENLAPIGFRSPDRPACSRSLYRLRYPAHCLHEHLPIFMTISRSTLLLMRNLWDRICRENQNTHFMRNNCFSRKLRRFWDNVEKCGTAREATDDYIAHAHCMLDN